jgi:H+/Cl- antiporter ClcA
MTAFRRVLFQSLKWLCIATLVGVLAGSASAIFLMALDWATAYREEHHWLIGFLPVAGLFMGWIYFKFGQTVESGNHLILDEIHTPQRVVPLRMTPLVFAGSVVTHLFGGSAGREGTAVQMGGSLADQLSIPLHLSAGNRRVLLMTGISAGFASIFGTPLAGLVFGLEVLNVGMLRVRAIGPCLIAAFVGHYTALRWGIHHTTYPLLMSPSITGRGIFYAVLAGILFGITGRLFATSTHAVSAWAKKKVRFPPLRPFIGGVLVLALVGALGSTRYIGLGIPVIRASFMDSVPTWDFAWKFLFTVVTLGFGFKGGEVTPLFFMGATLGNTLARILPLPAPLLVGMGFSAVFAGAANTPLACTLMAIELFGRPSFLYIGIACIVSALCAGRAGIYHSPGREK